VGVRKAEVEAPSETEAASEEPSPPSPKPITESETPAVEEAAPAVDEAAPAVDEAASDETTVEAAEEQDQDVDAVEGQVSETTEGPSER
jgi:hypothetical protein